MKNKEKNTESGEIKKWIDKWSKLKQSPKRDMAIKIWSRIYERQETNSG